MEGERERSLAHPSASFRLHSPSLNSVRLRRIFDLLDQNGDGELTLDEISLALDRLGLCVEDPAELASTVAGFIRPGRGGLSFEDFEGLHLALGDSLFGPKKAAATAEERDEDMVAAFQVFDEDGDGFISAAELQAVLGKLGLAEGRSITRVQEMICSVDRNRDGRVDFSEFKHMMQSISVGSA